MRAWERRTPRLALVAASVLVVAHPAAAQQGFAEGQILLVGRRAVLRMGGRPVLSFDGTGGVQLHLPLRMSTVQPCVLGPVIYY